MVGKRHIPWRPLPNVAKRARALGIMRRKGIKPLTKAQARAACAAAVEAKP